MHCCQVRESLKKGSLQARASKASFETVLADERIKFQFEEERNQRQFSRHDGPCHVKGLLTSRQCDQLGHIAVSWD